MHRKRCTFCSITIHVNIFQLLTIFGMVLVVFIYVGPLLVDLIEFDLKMIRESFTLKSLDMRGRRAELKTDGKFSSTEAELTRSTTSTTPQSSKMSTTSTSSLTTTKTPPTTKKTTTTQKNLHLNLENTQDHQKIFTTLKNKIDFMDRTTKAREALLINNEFRKTLEKLPTLLQNKLLSEIFLNELDDENLVEGSTSLLKDDEDLKFHYLVRNNNIVRSRPANLICLGAKKCGTGALRRFLSYHSKIRVSRAPETHFFDMNWDESEREKYKKSKNKQDLPPRTIEGYKSMFPNAGSNDYLFEKTPRYFSSDFVPARVKKIYENYGNSAINHSENQESLKFVVILCDPAKRTYSDYVHTFSNLNFMFIRSQLIEDYEDFDDYVQSGLEKIKYHLSGDEEIGHLFGGEEKYPIKTIQRFGHQPIEQKKYGNSFLNMVNSNNQTVKHELSLSMITKSLYYSQLQNWLKYFNLDQFIFIDGDKLISNPGYVLEDFQAKLGLDIEITESDFVRNENTGFYCFSKNGKMEDKDCLSETKGRTGSHKKQMSSASRAMLQSFFEDYNRKLFDLIDQRFDW